MKIAITGASGTMGKETVKNILKLVRGAEITALIEGKFSDILWAERTSVKSKKRFKYFIGDIRRKIDVIKLVEGAEYVLHLCAIIPPKSEISAQATWDVNYGGTKYVVDVLKEGNPRAKLVHISSVAVYGNRNMAHPWGRVGDPLIPSVFDSYGASKLAGERYVLESGLENFVVLRQTGILHQNLLIDNIKDGLMFHTPWNVPIEWVSAEDSGRLMAEIIAKDRVESLGDFWKRAHDIGGGAGMRETGYRSFDMGFGVIGGSVKDYFAPNWNATRNFHCFWFADSDGLEERFHFRSKTSKEFWADFQRRHKLYALGKILPPKLLGAMVIKPLLRDKNAPMRWEKAGESARVLAAFGRGGMSKCTNWEAFPIASEEPMYEELKARKEVGLDYGFDIEKPLEEVTLSDVQNAAMLRGGECLAKEMRTGCLWEKLPFRCAEGHEFWLTPYAMLAGHWCPECAMPKDEWRFDSLAKKSKYHGQVWYDSHEIDEDYIYRIKDKKYIAEEVK